MQRRQFLLYASAPSIAANVNGVWAQQPGFPNKQITLVSVSAAGGNSDAVCRTIGTKLSELLKVPVIVENRPGASGAIASSYVARCAADGYTLLAGSVASHVIYPLIGKVQFDPSKDFSPVTILGTNANLLVVGADSPANSVQDILAAARAKPGTLSYGSPGIGSSQHLSGELLQKLTRTKLIHVPNARGSVLTDVMAGHINMTFEGPSVLPLVLSGKLRALAVTSKQRSSQLPSVPTMIEAGVKDFEVTSWQALYAPAGTPKDVVDKVHASVAAVLATPEVGSRFQQMGLTPGGMMPSEFAAFQKAEIAKWAAVVKESGVVLE